MGWIRANFNWVFRRHQFCCLNYFFTDVPPYLRWTRVEHSGWRVWVVFQQNLGTGSMMFKKSSGVYTLLTLYCITINKLKKLGDLILYTLTQSLFSPASLYDLLLSENIFFLKIIEIWSWDKSWESRELAPSKGLSEFEVMRTKTSSWLRYWSLFRLRLIRLLL